MADTLADILPDVIADDLSGELAGGYPVTESAVVRFSSWEANAYTLGSDPDVATLHNLIPGGPDINPTQSTAAARPHLTTDLGVPVIHFDGTDDQLSDVLSSGTLWSSGQYMARVAIYRLPTPTSGDVYDQAYVDGGAAYGMVFRCTGQLETIQHLALGNIIAQASYVPPTAEYHTWTTLLQAAGPSIAINAYDELTASANAGSVQSPDGMSLGALSSGSGFGEMYLYDYTLLVNSDPDQLAADVAVVEAYYDSILPYQEQLSFTDGLVMRVQADPRYLTAVSGDVAGVTSLVHGHSWEQASAGSRPAWNTEQVNGHPTMAFDADEYLTSVAHSDFAFGTGSWMMAAILKRPFDTIFAHFLSFSDEIAQDGIRIRMHSADAPYVIWGGQGSEYYPVVIRTVPDNTWCVMITGIDAVNAERFQKVHTAAIQRSATTVQSAASTVAPRLHGVTGQATEDDDSWVLRELLVWKLGSAEITDANINAVASYANARYGVSI